MTKKKALIYLIIFTVSVSLTAVWKHFYLKDPSKNFPKACRPVIAPSCQGYIDKLSKEKRYQRAVEIQKVRIKENEKLLNFYKKQITNKGLLSMDIKETDKYFRKHTKTKEEKRDFFILKAAEFTLRDVIIDSLAVAEIEKEEFRNPEAAKKTLTRAIKTVNKNTYFFAKEQALKELQTQIEQLKQIEQIEKTEHTD